MAGQDHHVVGLSKEKCCIKCWQTQYYSTHLIHSFRIIIPNEVSCRQVVHGWPSLREARAAILQFEAQLNMGRPQQCGGDRWPHIIQHNWQPTCPLKIHYIHMDKYTTQKIIESLLVKDSQSLQCNDNRICVWSEHMTFVSALHLI